MFTLIITNIYFGRNTLINSFYRQYELTPSPLLAKARYRFRGGDRALPITDRILKGYAAGDEATFIDDDEE